MGRKKQSNPARRGRPRRSEEKPAPPDTRTAGVAYGSKGAPDSESEFPAPDDSLVAQLLTKAKRAVCDALEERWDHIMSFFTMAAALHDERTEDDTARKKFRYNFPGGFSIQRKEMGGYTVSCKLSFGAQEHVEVAEDVQDARVAREMPFMDRKTKDVMNDEGAEPEEEVEL